MDYGRIPNTFPQTPYELPPDHTRYHYAQHEQYGSYFGSTTAFLHDELKFRRPQQFQFPTSCANSRSVTQEWTPYEHQHHSRYSSPGDSYVSSPSDASSASDAIFSPSIPSQPIRYSASAVDIHNYHTLKTPVDAAPHHMTWEPQSRFINYIPQTVAPNLLPTIHPSIIKEEEPQLHDDPQFEFDLEEDTYVVHPNSLTHNPEPEVLELSEPSIASTASSSFGEHTHARKGPKEYLSDDEIDEEGDAVALADEHPSDSEFTPQTKRRRNSRNSGTKNLKSPSHRRRISNQPILDSKIRIHKPDPTASPVRSNHNRRASKPMAKPKGPVFIRKRSFSSSSPPNKGDRVFPCTFHHFGCLQEFPNKNEWKRHVACQHLQLGYYRCDLDGCDPDNCSSQTSNTLSRPQARRTSSSYSQPTIHGTCEEAEEIVKIYNDFNRKDLFTQHCRRMHGPTRNAALCTSSSTTKNGAPMPTKEDEASFEQQLESIRRRCWHVRRRAPARSNCPFCSNVFDSSYYTQSNSSEGTMGAEEKAWEERMEHLGRHYEKDRECKKDVEELDEDLILWGLETGVLRRLESGKVWLASMEPALPIWEESEVVEHEGRPHKKARRQPSRTVVVQKRGVEVKHEDSDEDADGEDE